MKILSEKEYRRRMLVARKEERFDCELRRDMDRLNDRMYLLNKLKKVQEEIATMLKWVNPMEDEE